MGQGVRGGVTDHSLKGRGAAMGAARVVRFLVGAALCRDRAAKRPRQFVLRS
ncbi:hypothetical protein D3C80_1899060 [compost metagenome]